MTHLKVSVESLFNVYGWGILSPGVKQVVCVTDEYLHLVTKVQNKWNYTFAAPVCIIHGVFRNNFAL
jgi:hypothetical protein